MRSKYEEEQEKIKAELARKKKDKVPGIVPLMELLTGEYWVKKGEEERQAELRKEKRRLKLEAMKVNPIVAEAE